MMRLKFTEEPFAWVGVRAWPFMQSYHEARLWGKVVAFLGLIIFLFVMFCII